MTLPAIWSRGRQGASSPRHMTGDRDAMSKTKTTVKARRSHQCSLCGYTIPAGEEYFFDRYGPMHHPENEGFFSVRAHVGCMSMWRVIGNDFDWQFPETGGDFIEAVTGAGLAVCCQTCDGNGRVEETEGTALPRRSWWPAKGLNWTECPSCDGYGYRQDKPTPTAKMAGDHSSRD
jgi:rubredoxin